MINSNEYNQRMLGTEEHGKEELPIAIYDQRIKSSIIYHNTTLIAKPTLCH